MRGKNREQVMYLVIDMMNLLGNEGAMYWSRRSGKSNMVTWDLSYGQELGRKCMSVWDFRHGWHCKLKM
jgi:hypothetical protein